jgi:hypothetical protein
MAARRQRREEENRLRQEASDGCLAKEYAQRMLEWGTGMTSRIQSIERFIEVRCVVHSFVFFRMSI